MHWDILRVLRTGRSTRALHFKHESELHMSASAGKRTRGACVTGEHATIKSNKIMTAQEFSNFVDELVALNAQYAQNPVQPDAELQTEAQEQPNIDEPIVHVGNGDGIMDFMAVYLEVLDERNEQNHIQPERWAELAMLRTFTSEIQRQSECGQCSICLENYPVGTIVRQLPCNHKFHDACISEWIQTPSLTCPDCRYSLRYWS